MKRDYRLRGLSSDHHHALVLARKARLTAESGDDANVEKVWTSVRQEFRIQIEPHFRVEETYLLPALDAAGCRDAVKRTLDEHRSIRRYIEMQSVSGEDLLAFAGVLKAHVQYEERKLFPLAEKELTEENLEKILLVSKKQSE